MKFISKNSNLRVVLRHGTPSEPISGRNAQPGLYVKFENGIVNVQDPEMIEMMLAHNGFSSGDYIAAEEVSADPYAATRHLSEPVHEIQEIEFGHGGRRITPPKAPFAVSEEQKKFLVSIAAEMAKDMFDKMMAESHKDKIDPDDDTSEEEKVDDIVEEEDKDIVEEKVEVKATSKTSKASKK